MCVDWPCPIGKWKCNDGSCISESNVCDGWRMRANCNTKISEHSEFGTPYGQYNCHCKDGSDEAADLCALWNCSANLWKCGNNICEKRTRVCDGHTSFWDCFGDGSDELSELCSDWECSEELWKCRDTNRCIKKDKVCDGDIVSFPYMNLDRGCDDESDEDPEMCPHWNCSTGRSKCDDGLQCVDEDYFCNGKSNCKDGSDEAHCEDWVCPKGKWKCKDKIGCIENKYVCDGKTRFSCKDSSDEDPSICLTWNCSSQFLWKCYDNSKCVHVDNIFDGRRDCKDGSDENQTFHVGRTCPDGYHICDDQLQCIPNESWCNGFTLGQQIGKKDPKGCRDNSDEGEHCKSYNCPPDLWKCADNLQCIKAEHVCDRNIRYNKDYNCNDKSDEDLMFCGCTRDEFLCEVPAYPWPDRVKGVFEANNRKYGCVKGEYVCDNNRDCKDNSDEDKTFCEEWTCVSGYQKCKDNNALCAPRCDGKVQCLDKSDEADCFNYKCLMRSRKCADNLQCIEKDDVCDDDGRIHCLDGSDALCNAPCLTSKLGLWDRTIVRKCKEDTTKCFPIEKNCDRVADCPLGSDETDSYCTCMDWKLDECQLNGLAMCVYPEWNKQLPVHSHSCTISIGKWTEDTKELESSGMYHIFQSVIILLSIRIRFGFLILRKI